MQLGIPGMVVLIVAIVGQKSELRIWNLKQVVQALDGGFVDIDRDLEQCASASRLLSHP